MRFITVQHIHDWYHDREYESLKAMIFDSFLEAQVHLSKRLNPDFNCYIAIETLTDYPVFFRSGDGLNWQCVPRISISEDILNKLESLDFKFLKNQKSDFTNGSITESIA